MSEETALAQQGNGPSALAVPDHRQAVAALALMSDAEFNARLEAMVTAQERMARVHKELMQPEIDFGKVPGAQRPSLWQPGAEKLCALYRLVPEFRHEVDYGDGDDRPEIAVISDCRLHLETQAGPVVGSASGASTSWERKYRYRSGYVCPACGQPGTIARSNYDDRGWYCNAKRGGCSAKFKAGDPGIESQPGQVENPDPFDLLNTLIAMADKRSYVAATRRATATSGLYAEPYGEQEPKRPAQQERKPAAGRSQEKSQEPPSGAAPRSGETAAVRAARERVEAALAAIDPDATDQGAVFARINGWMGRPADCSERATLPQWERAATAAEAELAGREAEEGATQRTLEGVRGAEAGTYAQMTGA